MLHIIQYNIHYYIIFYVCVLHFSIFSGLYRVDAVRFVSANMGGCAGNNDVYVTS